MFEVTKQPVVLALSELNCLRSMIGRQVFINAFIVFHCTSFRISYTLETRLHLLSCNLTKIFRQMDLGQTCELPLLGQQVQKHYNELRYQL